MASLWKSIAWLMDEQGRPRQTLAIAREANGLAQSATAVGTMPMALLSQRHLRGLCILMSIKDRDWDRVVWDCELRFRKRRRV